jgi:hypothetical protein
MLSFHRYSTYYEADELFLSSASLANILYVNLIYWSSRTLTSPCFDFQRPRVCCSGLSYLNKIAITILTRCRPLCCSRRSATQIRE